MITKNILNSLSPHIADLPIRLPERLALHYAEQSPEVSNERLAHLLSMSPRGVQNLLRRLREKQLIECVGYGRARRMFPLFHKQQRNKGDVPVGR